MKKINLRALIALLISAALSATLVACGGGGHSANLSSAQKANRSIKHVFVVTLENKNYDETFGSNSPAPYLSQTLANQGALLRQYYGTGHVSLDNYISMLSGQAATNETGADCLVFQDFVMTGMTADGQAIGTGCVYPASIKTLPDQMKEIGLSWKGYMEDMGNDPARESATCGHPALNTNDRTQSAQAPSVAVPLGDQYANRHNPFMYFHSIIDSPDCVTHVVNLNVLQQDLQSIDNTANFTFITPNLCNDGHDGSPGHACANGDPGGLISADTFLQKWVPMIMASPAYKKDGLLIINFDEGNYTIVDGKYTFIGAHCCNEQPGPNATRPAALFGIINIAGIGGDNTGAVLLSPFIKPGTVTNTPYNHYSLLKSLEQIFGINQFLGYAGQDGLVSFGDDVYTGL